MLILHVMYALNIIDHLKAISKIYARSDGAKPIYLPTTSLCGGIIKVARLQNPNDIHDATGITGYYWMTGIPKTP